MKTKDMAAYMRAYRTKVRGRPPRSVTPEMESVRAERMKLSQIKRSRKYYEKNASSIKAKVAKWAKTAAGVASRKNKQHKRRARCCGCESTATQKQVNGLLSASKKCHYFGVAFTKRLKATIDHVQPLSKGGSHSINNLVAACFGCNRRKSAKEPAVFANEIGVLFI